MQSDVTTQHLSLIKGPIKPKFLPLGVGWTGIISQLDLAVKINITTIFFPTPCIIFLMGCLMTSFLPSTGRSLDCLLLEPGLMPQSLSSEVSDVRPTHLDSTESKHNLTVQCLEKDHITTILHLNKLNLKRFKFRFLLQGLLQVIIQNNFSSSLLSLSPKTFSMKYGHLRFISLPRGISKEIQPNEFNKLG